MRLKEVSENDWLKLKWHGTFISNVILKDITWIYNRNFRFNIWHDNLFAPMNNHVIYTQIFHVSKIMNYEQERLILLLV